jgi:Ca2+-binding EF-hand superfamily protein
MYDFDNNGSIGTEDLLDLLTLMIGGNVTKHQLESIANRMVIEADLDEDDEISFDEFCEAVKKVDVENKMSMLHLKG